MKYFSHLNSAVQIIDQYKSNEPFPHFIKNYFRQYKKFGSTDRRTISQLCYCYFRITNAAKSISIEERILIGIFLCNHSYNELLAHFRPDWNSDIHIPLAEKLSTINSPFSIRDIFPWQDELSIGIDHEKFCESFLIQPDLFLRIRPKQKEIVLRKLNDAKIEFRQINDSCIALNNSTKIEDVIEVNKEAVVQDYNSQEVGNLFQLETQNSKPETVWDCCAASGGKSIMLYDINPNIQLTVSDIRESILVNLKKRFEEAGIKKYRSYVADLSSSNYQLPTANFDLIIADVPCSGSGTWSRTPESLSYFKENEIEKYSELQKKIITNIIPSLKKNGKLVYITCSVFKKENEEMVDFILQKFPLQLEKMEVLKGYEMKADTMFAASFISV